MEFKPKCNKYTILIPVINEGSRILRQLKRAQIHGLDQMVDIILCDGGSTDGSTKETILRSLGVNTLLIKEDAGKQGAQLRMGIWWALNRGYEGVVTMDGNNKDSIEDVVKFIGKLEQGYDYIQGSRFIKGGKAINTPLIRYISVRFIHAPIISFTAHHWFTDTTNAYRAYSKKYLTDARVMPLRACFMTYELLAYLSVRASQLGMKVCEVPVKRAYPKSGKIPTKISLIKGNSDLLKILISTMFGKYNPAE
jgi:dolichol-phosphate mannosyltransferase